MSVNTEKSTFTGHSSKSIPAKAKVGPSLPKTIVGGFAGGIAFSITSFLTFVLIGSGLDQSALLFDPSIQSSKFLAVWTEMEPLPLFVTMPYVILLGYVLFGIGHALLFRSVAKAWPEGVLHRTWRLTLVVWSLSCLFFEFLGPFNLLGEPPGLVVLELIFWAVTALAESMVIVLILERADRRR